MEKKLTTAFEVNDRVLYTDEHGERKGSIVEIDEVKQRARIKWDERKSRTWIRFSALIKTLTVLLIALTVGCTKSVDTPDPVEDPQQPAPEVRAHFVCDEWAIGDIVIRRNGTRLDTLPVGDIRPKTIIGVLRPGVNVDEIKICLKGHFEIK